jgi:hypothetical protein
MTDFQALTSEQLATAIGGFRWSELARAGFDTAAAGARGGAVAGGAIGDAIGRRAGGVIGALVYPTPDTMANSAAAGGALGRWTGAGVAGALGGAGGLVVGTSRNAYQQLNR